jgi:hypothetical protein
MVWLLEKFSSMVCDAGTFVVIVPGCLAQASNAAWPLYFMKLYIRNPMEGG